MDSIDITKKIAKTIAASGWGNANPHQATTVSIKIISIESDMSMTPTLKIYDIKKVSLKKSGSEYVG